MTPGQGLILGILAASIVVGVVQWLTNWLRGQNAAIEQEFKAHGGPMWE